MRLCLLFFIIFSLIIFPVYSSEPAKVVAVIPVKFNSKGNHAPLPYSQQMMQRGWASVPTLSQPFTGGQPRYQPQRIAKPNLIRALSSLGQRAANMSPAGKIALVAYGAYEANCTSQLFTSLCFDEEVADPQTDFSDFTPAKKAPVVVCQASAGAVTKLFTGLDFSSCAASAKSALNTILTLPPASESSPPSSTGSHTRWVRSWSPITYILNSTSIRSGFKITESSTSVFCRLDLEGSTSCEQTANPPRSYDSVATITQTDTREGFACPDAPYTNGPILLNNVQSCFKVADRFKRKPVDEDWLTDQIAKNPQTFINADIGLDDFVDWETGAPRPELFDSPKYDPVSKIFADAAESIANGTAQSTNPNGSNYIPAEMMPNLLIQINNWHEGNTFTDVFTNQQITPDAAPKEETPVDWSKFPGLTKSQYENTNNSWGNSATANKPDIDSDINDIKDQQLKFTEFVESPLPDLPFEIDFPSLFQLPTAGNCRGFTVNGTISGKSIPILVDKHCPPYEAWGRPVIDWFLSILTIFQCFHIFRRTIEVA